MKKIAIYTDNDKPYLLRRIKAKCDNLGIKFKNDSFHLPISGFTLASIILNPVDFNLLRLSVYGDCRFIENTGAYLYSKVYDVYYADHCAEG